MYWLQRFVYVVLERHCTPLILPQPLRHIALSISGSGAAMENYCPGDVLCVWPRPEASSVDAFLERMGWDGAQMVRVESEADHGQGAMAIGTLRAFVEASFSLGKGSLFGAHFAIIRTYESLVEDLFFGRCILQHTRHRFFYLDSEFSERHIMHVHPCLGCSSRATGCSGRVWCLPEAPFLPGPRALHPRRLRRRRVPRRRRRAGAAVVLLQRRGAGRPVPVQPAGGALGARGPAGLPHLPTADGVAAGGLPDHEAKAVLHRVIC